jgi:hypothetical protein
LDIFGPLFGSQANVLKNNIAYVPPVVVEADYMSFEDLNNGHGFNATAISTYDLASNWKKLDNVKTSTSGDIDSSYAFVLCDDIIPVSPDRGRKYTKGPAPKATAINNIGRTSKRSFPKKTDKPEWTRKCHLCQFPDHLIANCPENPRRISEKVMIAIGDADEADEDAIYDSAFMCCDEHDELITLFSATEVILDNAAGRPVFKSRQLLDNVQTITPYRIEGVDVNSNGIVVRS